MQLKKTDEVDVLRAAQQWARELPAAGYLRRQEFVRWIRHSPEHLQAYLSLTALETELPGLQEATQIDLDCALSRVSATVTVLPGRSKPSSPGPSLERTYLPATSWSDALRIAAVAAGVVLLILGTWLFNRQPGRLITENAEFTTDIGQRRSFVLSDGTSVQLNTNSAIRKSYDTERRNLTLFKGEAWIRVGVDSHRPFSVDVGSVRIKDVGTEFTVRTEPQETTVYVIRGRVQLRINPGQDASVIELARDEEAVIRMDSEQKPLLHYKHRLTAAEANKRLAWTTGKMVLTGEPLSDVVREINRYHRKQLVITDKVLEQIKVGGIIDPATNDYRVIVRALGSDCPIAIDDTDPAFVRLAIDQVNGVCKNRRGGHAAGR